MACNETYTVFNTVNVHIKWIHCKLCNQIITIEAAKYISSLKNWEFGLGNLIILPACLSKLLFCYLKGIS